ncbi:unnamed protein product [Gongylonema pulchrum]|uniref:Uncharacterized protein n=1 Tax=Gongylonema pulchrum TaxID=637853 RepID=A0A183DRB3_9BILA|nr:unnamed protein product [Gongylonema pulchrum]
MVGAAADFSEEYLVAHFQIDPSAPKFSWTDEFQLQLKYHPRTLRYESSRLSLRNRREAAIAVEEQYKLLGDVSCERRTELVGEVKSFKTVPGAGSLSLNIRSRERSAFLFPISMLPPGWVPEVEDGGDDNRGNRRCSHIRLSSEWRTTTIIGLQC